jgi:uncharacterized integral membrane protein
MEDDEHDPTQAELPNPEPAVSSREPEPEAPEPEPAAEPAAPHRVPIEIGPRFYATLAAFLFFIAYSIAFIVGNSKTISVDFVFATARVSVIWMIVLLLAVGLVGGILLVELYRHRGSKQPREQ